MDADASTRHDDVPVGGPVEATSRWTDRSRRRSGRLPSRSCSADASGRRASFRCAVSVSPDAIGAAHGPGAAFAGGRRRPRPAAVPRPRRPRHGSGQGPGPLARGPARAGGSRPAAGRRLRRAAHHAVRPGHPRPARGDGRAGPRARAACRDRRGRRPRRAGPAGGRRAGGPRARRAAPGRGQRGRHPAQAGDGDQRPGLGRRARRQPDRGLEHRARRAARPARPRERGRSSSPAPRPG